MKQIRGSIFFFFLIFLLIEGCKKETIYDDVPPQLEVIVKTTNGNVVSGANVLLFTTLEDWQEETNQVASQLTSSTGCALFEKLEEKVYFFYAKKGSQDNTLGIVTFISPLRINQIKVIETTIN